jgi:transcriptional regulator with XRE-family HTH domain
MTHSYVAPSAAAGLLQLARLKSGLSQGRVADLAGVPATMISAYERDKRQPTLPTLLRLLNAAGFDLRMQLVPLADHENVLTSAEDKRTPVSAVAETDRSQRGKESRGDVAGEFSR